jgi:hypothetical protein
MKLTSAQKQMIERLKRADEIHYGVSWFIYYTGKRGRRWSDFVDGRVCNALVRMGILQRIEGTTHYTLHEPTEGQDC